MKSSKSGSLSVLGEKISSEHGLSCIPTILCRSLHLRVIMWKHLPGLIMMQE